MFAVCKAFQCSSQTSIKYRLNTVASMGKRHLGTAITIANLAHNQLCSTDTCTENLCCFARQTTVQATWLISPSEISAADRRPQCVPPPAAVYDVGDTYLSSSYARDGLSPPYAAHICAEMLIVCIAGFGRISTASKLTGFSCENCLGMGLSRSLVMGAYRRNISGLHTIFCPFM